MRVVAGDAQPGEGAWSGLGDARVTPDHGGMECTSVACFLDLGAVVMLAVGTGEPRLFIHLNSVNPGTASRLWY